MDTILLRTLGGVDLRAPDGRAIQSVLAQPKRFALLVYLAVGEPRRLYRRERLLALFWPHLDEAHARNSLSQALSTLRRGLHADLFVTRGDEEIGLAPGLIDCDVSAFERAHGEGRLREALQLYGGGFLDGFSLADAAPDLARWMEDERGRLGTMAGGAALALAAEAERAQEIEAALEWARRAATIAPHDEAAAAATIRLLARSGDRAGALLAYREYARWLTEALELEPSAELRALAEAIRTQPPAARAAEPPGDGAAPAAERLVSPQSLQGSQAHRVGKGSGPSAADRMGRRARTDGRSVGRRSAPVAVAALAATLVGIALSGAAAPRPEALTPAASSARTIAVLPFEDLCGGGGGAALVAGTHTELVTQLSRISALQVSSVLAVRRFAGSATPAREIAAALGVGALLNGSVRCEGDRIRVSVQLVEPVRDRNLWADQYDRRRGDLFDVQTEIALSVAAALEADLTAAERGAIARRPTRSDEAYEIYLRAREYQRRAPFDEEDGRAAERLYLRALELDPAFALAHARLAGVHEYFYMIGWDRTPERLEAWRDATETAVRLAPDLPEAHFARGSYWVGRREFERALHDLEVALVGAPNDADVHLQYGWVLCRLQRWTECIDEGRRAVELESHTADHLEHFGFLLWYMDRYPEAVEVFDRVLEIAPDHHGVALYRGRVFVDWHDTTDSLAAVLRRLPPEWDPNGVRTANRALLGWFERKPDEVIAALDASRHDALIQWHYAVPFSLLRGRAYAELGDTIRSRDNYLEAVVFLEDRVREEPDMAMRRALLGRAYAGLGRKADALREITRATELESITRNAMEGAAILEQTAEVLVLLGEVDAALQQIEVLVAQPSPVSIPRLRREARWDPLRGDLRFERLLRDGR